MGHEERDAAEVIFVVLEVDIFKCLVLSIQKFKNIQFAVIFA